jgi:hypothetical protein
LFLEHQPNLSGRLTAWGLLHECVSRHPLFLTSPRPSRRMILLILCSTSLWSAHKPSMKVCWSYLIPVRLAVLQATTMPCLHFKPLDLLFRSLMFDFVCTQEDFRLWIPVHPMRPYRRHVFASPQHDFVSAAMPTRRSRFDRHGYPRVPTDQSPGGPCQVYPTCQKRR